MESRSSLFDFDVRYKTEGNDKTFHALSKGMAMREGGASSTESSRDTDTWRSEHSGIEEQIVLL